MFSLEIININNILVLRYKDLFIPWNNIVFVLRYKHIFIPRNKQMIISILNQKGGVGKTTLAVNLARGYMLNGAQTLLVDSDKQGSARRWHERSGGELIDLTCLPVETLHRDVIKYTDMYERIIIDGVPSVSPLTLCAIKAADLILIPVQPSPYDIWATEDLVRNVKDRIEMTDGRTKAAFVVSRKISGTNIGKEIYGELEKLGLHVFQNGTCQRVSYSMSVQDGMSVLDGDYRESGAAREIINLIAEIEGYM
jgi:chromosome partitioning protein